MSRGLEPEFSSQPQRVGNAESRAVGVSVVIPAHNYAHYLLGAIASGLAQTHRELEVIVIDDGSTDDTRAIVAQQPDPRVRYIWQENAGLSAARNTGIHEARFPFVAFLDADDLWLPSLLADVMRQFAQLSDSFALVATNSFRMDSAGAHVESRYSAPEPDRELTARDFVLRNRPLSSSIVIRRDVFAKCGDFDTSLRSSEDRDMWIRAAKRYRVWFIGQPLALIRRHSGNMSKNAARMMHNSRAVLRKAWSSAAVSHADIPFWLRAWSVHYFQIAWTHFDEGLRLRPLAYLTTSVLLYPIFLRPGRITERPLFRLRTLARFLLTAPAKVTAPPAVEGAFPRTR